MTNTFLTGLFACAALGLSGCDQFDGFGNPTLRDTSQDNINLANAEAAPITPVLGIPTTGLVTYDGVIAANTTGAHVGSLYADLSMGVDFGSNVITGSITNVDLVNDTTGNVVQDLAGSLTLAGTQTLGGVVATATGSLTGTGPVTGVGTAAFVLAGTVRSDVTAADTVFGTMDGTVGGGFALDLSAGEFYGTAP